MSDTVAGRVGAALRAHVDARRRAEEQRAAFAFTERPAPGTGVNVARGAGGTIALDPADWRWFIARTLRSAGDPGALRLLGTLRDGPVSIADAGRELDPAGQGRVAVAERIGDLAAAGLVARELEGDEVSLAPLGAAVLDLVADVERHARVDAS